MNILIFLIMLAMCFTLFILGGCAKTEEETPENVTKTESSYEETHADNADGDRYILQTVKNTDTKNRTWYEVFVYSFRDSNGDGIGDLNGVTEMLDYIEYMGFSGIWLTPIHPSGTYHKYDVSDYFGIDPQYGTQEDFDRLIEECEKRGIAVILDLVVNHTSSSHKWFKQALSAIVNGDEDNSFIEYYNFSREAGNGQWKSVGNNWFYECQFWSEMPDLNLENLEVRRELEAVFKFWLDRGVSGFRLDAAKEYVTGNTEKNIEILSWINGYVKSVKPDAYLVGEVWEANTGLYDYYRSGIDSFFNFNFSAAEGRLAKTLLLKNQTAKAYTDALLMAQNTIKANNPNSTDASFFTNHDTARASGFLRRDDRLIKMAWGMSLTQSGNAFVYYGEEIGMLGSGADPNKRAPMLWTEDLSADGMTYNPPGAESVAYEFPSVEQQRGDTDSILEYIRKAVIFRNKYPAMAGGIIDDIIVFDDKSCAVHKSYNGEEVSLYYNFSDDYSVISSKELNFEPDNTEIDGLYTAGEEYDYSGGELKLPPYSIMIVKTK